MIIAYLIVAGYFTHTNIHYMLAKAKMEKQQRELYKLDGVSAEWSKETITNEVVV